MLSAKQRSYFQNEMPHFSPPEASADAFYRQTGHFGNELFGFIHPRARQQHEGFSAGVRWHGEGRRGRNIKACATDSYCHAVKA